MLVPNLNTCQLNNFDIYNVNVMPICVNEKFRGTEINMEMLSRIISVVVAIAYLI